jgi:hypothetical protein
MLQKEDACDQKNEQFMELFGRTISNFDNAYYVNL